MTAAPSPEPVPAPAPVAAAPAPSVAQQMETIGTDADPVAARSHIKPEPFPEGQLPAAVGGGADSASTVATAVAPSEEAAAPPPQQPMPQDLTTIRGIDAATAVVLEREGVTRYEQLSAWNEGDVARINRALGGMRRVQEENWIEQASVLAGGGLTSFARRRMANAAAGGAGAAQIVQPSADQGSAVSLKPSPPAVAVPVAAAASAAASHVNGSTVSADVIGDDLTAVNGITPEIARTLKEQGISRYAQLARLDEAGASRLNGLLGIKDRVQNEGWIAQAAALAGISASAAVAASPVSSAEAASAAVGAAVSNDNLKRIRGIGELIEGKLFDMGYVTYAAIANWTEHDVRHVSQALDFRGRIERENWIEQARILATGGQTEFSRRFDTGG
ncbi:MAG: helix-hairpin-helix domain-containing protein [Pseudomonadota bacterium]